MRVFFRVHISKQSHYMLQELRFHMYLSRSMCYVSMASDSCINHHHCWVESPFLYISFVAILCRRERSINLANVVARATTVSYQQRYEGLCM